MTQPNRFEANPEQATSPVDPLEIATGPNDPNAGVQQHQRQAHQDAVRIVTERWIQTTPPRQ
jgi:hypothetical protein